MKLQGIKHFIERNVTTFFTYVPYMIKFESIKLWVNKFAPIKISLLKHLKYFVFLFLFKRLLLNKLEILCLRANKIVVQFILFLFATIVCLFGNFNGIFCTFIILRYFLQLIRFYLCILSL